MLRTADNVGSSQENLYRDKVRQLKKMSMVLAQWRKSGLGPAASNAVFSAIAVLVLGHIALAHFGQFRNPVFGWTPEVIALVTLFASYRMTADKRWSDRLYTLLSAYKPVDMNAYARLPEEIRRHRDRELELIRDWLGTEGDAIARASGYANVEAENLSPRTAFLFKKPGLRVVASAESVTDELNDDERTALALVGEALVKIRLLASKPLSKQDQDAIRELADALHNVPDYAAMTRDGRAANAFLLNGALLDARAIYQRHGWTSACMDMEHE